MSTMSKFKTEVVTTTATTRIGDRTVCVLGPMICPHCLARLHASAWRDIGEGEYAWTCQRCHRDVITITCS